jgi:magnesium-transporting ATPase (P-type)
MVQKYFRTPEAQEKTSDPNISFYSSSRIDKLVNILITFVIFCLLVIPVITMFQLTNTSSHVNVDASGNTTTMSNADIYNRDTVNAVGVLIVFTLLFSAAMSLLTKAARHELFAASAAYCAILVVFIGNFTGPGN